MVQNDSRIVYVIKQIPFFCIADANNIGIYHKRCSVVVVVVVVVVVGYRDKRIKPQYSTVKFEFYSYGLAKNTYYRYSNAHGSTCYIITVCFTSKE